MAYVVARRDGRFEIRESVATDRGPRSRTLATFRVLTDAVLDHAERRATRRFDREVVRHRATERGAPERTRGSVPLAAVLLADLRAGRRLPAVFADALRRELGAPSPDLPDTVDPAIDWLGATATDRGNTLRDLLRMTDRIPHRPRPPGRRFPRLRSSPA